MPVQAPDHDRTGDVSTNTVECAALPSRYRADVVAFDFLGHGDSPSPDQPNLYTEDEVLSMAEQ